MRPVLTGVLCSLTVVVLACSPQVEPPAGVGEKSSEADIQAILELEQKVFAAEAAGDLEAWSSLFDDDPILMPPDHPMITDIEAIREWARPLFEGYHLTEDSSNQEVRVADDWGYIAAQWVWTMTPKAGGETVVETGKSIWIVRRHANGSWRIARAIWNGHQPAAEQ